MSEPLSKSTSEILSCQTFGSGLKNVKPCPFCGRDIYHLRLFHEKTICDDGFTYEMFFVMCGCGADGPSKDTSALAKRAWNTRRKA